MTVWKNNFPKAITDISVPLSEKQCNRLSVTQGTDTKHSGNCQRLLSNIQQTTSQQALNNLRKTGHFDRRLDLPRHQPEAEPEQEHLPTHQHTLPTCTFPLSMISFCFKELLLPARANKVWSIYCNRVHNSNCLPILLTPLSPPLPDNQESRCLF